MRIVVLVGMISCCSCTGRSLPLGDPKAPSVPDLAVAKDLAVADPPDLSSSDLAVVNAECSQICGTWDHCSTIGAIGYSCIGQCEQQATSYVCLRGCDPTAECPAVLDCVASCGL